MTVNGKVYDWADVDFKVPGLDIEVQAVSYTHLTLPTNSRV